MANIDVIFRDRWLADGEGVPIMFSDGWFYISDIRINGEPAESYEGVFFAERPKGAFVEGIRVIKVKQKGG